MGGRAKHNYERAKKLASKKKDEIRHAYRKKRKEEERTRQKLSGKLTEARRKRRKEKMKEMLKDKIVGAVVEPPLCVQIQILRKQMADEGEHPKTHQEKKTISFKAQPQAHEELMYGASDVKSHVDGVLGSAMPASVGRYEMATKICKNTKRRQQQWYKSAFEPLLEISGPESKLLLDGVYRIMRVAGNALAEKGFMDASKVVTYRSKLRSGCKDTAAEVLKIVSRVVVASLKSSDLNAFVSKRKVLLLLRKAYLNSLIRTKPGDEALIRHLELFKLRDPSEVHPPVSVTMGVIQVPSLFPLVALAKAMDQPICVERSACRVRRAGTTWSRKVLWQNQ